MELIKHDHYAELKVDSPDNDKDIIELGLACRESVSYTHLRAHET